MIVFKCKISKMGGARMIRIPNAMLPMADDLIGQEIWCSLSTSTKTLVGGKQKKK